ncbi:MAG: UDP-N-acetylglucosamine 1-carboxyvinyltransferase, partial [Alphaproteobacteria bacterium]|nr:UDP-N-acetylglucosamine 1-carboxyvinyltransferase [Alphaproteobacteria bacterium]
MDKIKIRGGNALKGTIRIGGAKNAALPLMAASLLTDEPLLLSNVPHLADITTLANLLAQHGTQVALDGDEANGGHTGRVLSLTARDITSTTAPYDLVRKMRASVLVLGPLLAREGEAIVSLPGGCAIGTRPVDIHLAGFEALGAKIEVESGYIRASAPDGLRGARFAFPKVSVGATENVLLAASLAKGQSILENAAREPEITNLGECLIAMGAKIEGLGTDILTVGGVERLHGASHAIMPDRIEAGTYAMAAAITGGDVTLEGARLSHLDAAVTRLRRAGVSVDETSDGIRVSRANGALEGVDVQTDPYPGFPTDLQAQFLAMMTIADGASMITETIFENRFMHVPEL